MHIYIGYYHKKKKKEEMYHTIIKLISNNHFQHFLAVFASGR